MKAYKYRSDYEHIKQLSQSKIYAPNKQQLNDPFEGTVKKKIYDDYELIKPLLLPSKFEYKVNLHKKLFEQIKNDIGIYSLSKSWNNEVLWVHYSDTYKGYCIEYELNNLILEKMKRVIFPRIIKVKYSNIPPVYTLEGMDNIPEEQLAESTLQILIGTKSRPWRYEKEIRVLFNEYGEQEINHKAIKSIIFGAFASDKDINDTIILMSNKIKYYKIDIADNYKLLRKRL
jgi:hypothetical protein